MNVYYSKDFEGHYPVGTAAIVVAPSIEEARRMLTNELTLWGLPQERPFTLEKLVTRKPGVYVLLNGDY